MSIFDSGFIMITRVLLIFFCFNSLSICSTVDENGYIIYCPCMGRFGNQAEQFLGSLLFAKYLDRTLVLPPFIEYRNYQVEFSPFDKFFKLEPLKQYHKVILIEDFMTNIAPKVWIENERFILCYGPRKGDKDQMPDCNPFDGSPFKPFWHHFNITRFQSSIFHQPLITQFNEAKFWKEKYKDLRVLAFVGAPSSFPTNQEAIPLQKYLHFSDSIADSAAKYREVRGFTGKPYLGVHLRHGSDWIKACNLLKENDMNQLFSSDQCIQRDRVDSKEFKLPYELCSHSVNMIVEDINRALTDSENTHQLEVVYIATDYDDQSVWQQIHAKLPEVTLITPTSTYFKNNITRGYTQPHYIIDTYLLSYSNYFIGNCVSSFSAFASRIRLHSFNFERTTHFFASDLLHMEKLLKDEL